MRSDLCGLGERNHCSFQVKRTFMEHMGTWQCQRAIIRNKVVLADNAPAEGANRSQYRNRHQRKGD